MVRKQVKLLNAKAVMSKEGSAGDTETSMVNPMGQPLQSRPKGGTLEVHVVTKLQCKLLKHGECVA